MVDYTLPLPGKHLYVHRKPRGAGISTGNQQAGYRIFLLGMQASEKYYGVVGFVHFML